MVGDNRRTFTIPTLLLLGAISLSVYLKGVTENAIGTDLHTATFNAVASHYRKDIVTTGRWIERSAYPIARQLVLFRRDIARVDFPPELTGTINIPTSIEPDEVGRWRLGYYPVRLNKVQRYVTEGIVSLPQRIREKIADGWRVAVDIADSLGKRIKKLI
jgi:hypothetical protein